MFYQNKLKRLGLRIRQLRQKRKWTQLRLGVEIEASSSYIGHVERGERNPTFTMLLKLADALEIKPCDLFE